MMGILFSTTKSKNINKNIKWHNVLIKEKTIPYHMNWSTVNIVKNREQFLKLFQWLLGMERQVFYTE